MASAPKTETGTGGWKRSCDAGVQSLVLWVHDYLSGAIQGLRVRCNIFCLWTSPKEHIKCKHGSELFFSSYSAIQPKILTQGNNPWFLHASKQICTTWLSYHSYKLITCDLALWWRLKHLADIKRKEHYTYQSNYYKGIFILQLNIRNKWALDYGTEIVPEPLLSYRTNSVTPSDRLITTAITSSWPVRQVKYPCQTNRNSNYSGSEKLIANHQNCKKSSPY